MEWENFFGRELPRRQLLALGAATVGLLTTGATFKPRSLYADFLINRIQPDENDPTYKTNLMILTYHQVSSARYLINDYQFCRQKGWEAISFEDLGRFVVEERELPEYCFLPTFDDGFVEQKPSILSARENIQSQYGERYYAVVFGLTQYEHPSDPVETLPESTLTYREKDYYAEGEKPRHMALGDTIELLQKGGGDVRIEVHTMDHADLTSPLLSEGALLQQIVESQRRTDILYGRAGIERIFSALAYPNWRHNKRVRQLVEDIGYTMAFGGMTDRERQKIMEPVIQTTQDCFYLQRMSRT